VQRSVFGQKTTLRARKQSSIGGKGGRILLSARMSLAKGGGHRCEEGEGGSLSEDAEAVRCQDVLRKGKWKWWKKRKLIVEGGNRS